MISDINVNIDTQGEVEVEATLDICTIQDILVAVDDFDKRFGPNRDVGPVRMRYDDEGVRVFIDTQKQGTFIFSVDKFGRLGEATQ
jgi:hypothetical protein